MAYDDRYPRILISDAAGRIADNVGCDFAAAFHQLTRALENGDVRAFQPAEEDVGGPVYLLPRASWTHSHRPLPRFADTEIPIDDLERFWPEVDWRKAPRKRRPGRKPGDGAFNDAPHVARMREIRSEAAKTGERLSKSKTAAKYVEEYAATGMQIPASSLAQFEKRLRQKI